MSAKSLCGRGVTTAALALEILAFDFVLLGQMAEGDVGIAGATFGLPMGVDFRSGGAFGPLALQEVNDGSMGALGEAAARAPMTGGSGLGGSGGLGTAGALAVLKLNSVFFAQGVDFGEIGD
jgi:hypothetical protein